jgi:F-type H+-transporting ATPase subunit b
MLAIDGSLFIQIANFLLLMLILNIFLYRPIRRILIQRNEETGSLQKTIEGFQGRSEQSEKSLEESMILARKEGLLEKDGFKGQGLQEEQGILQKANSAVEERLAAAKKEMEMKIADIQKTLDDQIGGFSKELVEKILGRSIQ